MPSYDYFCDRNGRTVEAKHSMRDLIHTWGELCELTGHDPGNTPPDTAVRKLATGGQPISRSSLGEQAPQCGAGACSRCALD